jgi:hypothetical protein
VLDPDARSRGLKGHVSGRAQDGSTLALPNSAGVVPQDPKRLAHAHAHLASAFGVIRSLEQGIGLPQPNQGFVVSPEGGEHVPQREPQVDGRGCLLGPRGPVIEGANRLF